MRRAAPWLLLALAAGLLGVSRPPGLSDVVEVRHWSYDDYTRVVVELSGGVEPDLHRLPPNPRAGRPERLYLDLPGVWVGRRYADPIRVADGLLFGVRLGQNTLRTTRVVIDLKQYRRHRVLLLSSPPRVVVDIYGERERPEMRPTHPLPVELRAVRTVVLDAGHGGRDPGARGLYGLVEKDLTLRLALAVRDRLRERGFDVVMTRDRDRTLSLEERTAIAEGAGGDVFVSLHMNAAPRRAARGIETYYLNPSDQRHTLTVAARENGVSRSDVDALQRALAGLRVSEVSPHAEKLAQAVQRAAVAKLRQRWSTHDLGVKRGPFYVLFLSSMPSILVEGGFLTNRDEARRLRDPEYLERLADGIAEGVVAYAEEGTSLLAEGPR